MSGVRALSPKSCVYGSESIVQDPEFGVQGPVPRMLSLESRVQGVESRVQSPVPRIHGLKFEAEQSRV